MSQPLSYPLGKLSEDWNLPPLVEEMHQAEDYGENLGLPKH